MPVSIPRFQELSSCRSSISIGTHSPRLLPTAPAAAATAPRATHEASTLIAPASHWLADGDIGTLLPSSRTRMNPLPGCYRALANNASRRSSAGAVLASAALRQPSVLQVQLQLRHAFRYALRYASSTAGARPKTAIFFPGAFHVLAVCWPCLPFHSLTCDPSQTGQGVQLPLISTGNLVPKRRAIKILSVS